MDPRLRGGDGSNQVVSEQSCVCVSFGHTTLYLTGVFAGFIPAIQRGRRQHLWLWIASAALRLRRTSRVMTVAVASCDHVEHEMLDKAFQRFYLTIVPILYSLSAY